MIVKNLILCIIKQQGKIRCWNMFKIIVLVCLKPFNAAQTILLLVFFIKMLSISLYFIKQNLMFKY